MIRHLMASTAEGRYEHPHRFCAAVHHLSPEGTEVILEGLDHGMGTETVLRRAGEGSARSCGDRLRRLNTPIRSITQRPISRTTAPAGALLVFAIFLLALNLRMGIASVGPVLPQLVHDLGVTLVYASFLTAVPVVMMGIASPLSARLGARFAWNARGRGNRNRRRRYRRTVLGDVRDHARPERGALGCGIAAGNTMLPAIVRQYFPSHGAS